MRSRHHAMIVAFAAGDVEALLVLARRFHQGAWSTG